MENYDEKIGLLQEKLLLLCWLMVNCIVPEYDFLDIIAKQLEIDKPTFLNLFKNLKYECYKR